MIATEEDLETSRQCDRGNYLVPSQGDWGSCERDIPGGRSLSRGYVKRDSEVTGQAGRVVAGGVRSRVVGEPVGFGGRDGCY